MSIERAKGSAYVLRMLIEGRSTSADIEAQMIHLVDSLDGKLAKFREMSDNGKLLYLIALILTAEP